MIGGSRDLFDDHEMSFGEHLEELRKYLIRALLGVLVALVICLIFGKQLVAVVRHPIETALIEHGLSEYVSVEEDVTGEEFWEWVETFWKEPAEEEPSTDPDAEPNPEEPEKDSQAPTTAMELLNGGPTIQVEIAAKDLHQALQTVAPDSVKPSNPPAEQATVSLRLSSPDFAIFRRTSINANRPVTLAVPEAFMTMLKVSLVGGFVLASPWVFFQMWQFVAVGLMPHERKFVYIYGGVSLLLFLVGVLFCFFAVFPFVLSFLLSFNSYLDLQPQIRLSEWITFAITLPLMFGISFQLPLVMVFLERMQIFEVQQFREQRKVAYLIISVVSMLMTPSDPTSMIMMLIPLIGLYELGVWMCQLNPSSNPFDQAVTE